MDIARKIIEKYPIISYEIIAIGINWLLITPLILEKFTGIRLFVLPYHHYLGTVGPILAAIIVIYVTTGKKGLKSYVQMLFKWKLSIKWYLFPVGGPISILLVALTIRYLMSGSIPSNTLKGINVASFDTRVAAQDQGTWLRMFLNSLILQLLKLQKT